MKVPASGSYGRAVQLLEEGMIAGVTDTSPANGLHRPRSQNARRELAPRERGSNTMERASLQASPHLSGSTPHLDMPRLNSRTASAIRTYALYLVPSLPHPYLWLPNSRHEPCASAHGLRRARRASAPLDSTHGQRHSLREQARPS